MCIRDRFVLVALEHPVESLVRCRLLIMRDGSPKLCFGERAPGRQQRDDQVEQALGLGSVSYTHLRAHETVLDLVCRLLLEKKKSSEQ